MTAGGGHNDAVARTEDDELVALDRTWFRARGAVAGEDVDEDGKSGLQGTDSWAPGARVTCT